MSPVVITPGGARAPGVRTLRPAVLAGLVLALVLLLPALSEATCAAGFPATRFGNYLGEPTSRAFYPVAEASGSVTFRVDTHTGCGGTMSVNYGTSGGTAQAGSDYVPKSGQVLYTNIDGNLDLVHSDFVTILNNDVEEPVVESANLVLTNPQGLSLSLPSTAGVLIVDDDGPNRFGFEGVPYSQSETFTTVRVPVFRAGATTPADTVGWSISGGPGAPATPGQDVNPASGSVAFPAGVRWATINLTLNNDTLGEGTEEFTITLTEGSPSTMTFTIQDNEESERPTSRFHHPRHKWRYAKSDYRIREFHIFANDNPGGAGVVDAELALRRNLKNGTCAWKTRSGWQKKDCSDKTWLPTKYDDTGQLFFYRMNQLKPSVRTKINNYTAFSRAIDGAGNVERDFAQKRNDNTFEIKRKRK
jgi:hypothetical protein